MAKYNLLEEPWIPILKDGHVMEASLSECLLESPAFERVETSAPLEEVVLHRLLLAVLHRALDGPKDLDEALGWLEAGAFPKTPIEMYLERYHDRFFLFHETAPFFQVADLPEDPPPVPWVKLLPELASGNTPTLFDHTMDSSFRAASYAEAARALLVHETFATGGLLRRFGVTSAKGAPLATAAAFLPSGGDLFETLVLNLVPYSSGADVAVWERPPLMTKELEGAGSPQPLTGATCVYTWPSRGVRLLDEGTEVRFMAYGPGLAPLNVGWRDPMVAYVLSEKGGQLPLRLDTERSFWRDFCALLPAAGGTWPSVLEHATNLAQEHNTSYALRVMGQVADQAKILDVRREVYPLPRDLLSAAAQADLQQALREAEKVGEDLEEAGRRLAEGVLGGRDRAELAAFVNSLPLLRLFWADLDAAFPHFLERLGQRDALVNWRWALRRAAWQAWGTTRASLGHAGRHLKGIARGERELWTMLNALGLREVEEVRQ